MQASFAGWRRNCGLPRVPEIRRGPAAADHVDADPAAVSLSAAELAWHASTGLRAGRG